MHLKKTPEKEGGISLLSPPGKVYAKCLEGKYREILESKLEAGQCGFCPGRSTTDQIFTQRQIFEKSWEYAKDAFACFADLEKTYNRIPRGKLWRVLHEYGIDGHMLMTIKSLHCQLEVRVRVNGKQSKSFHVDVGLWQGCVLSLLFFHNLHELDGQAQPNR